MGKTIDLTGQRFGKLVVIRRAADHVYPNGSSQAMWECQCDCGNKKIVYGRFLRNGSALSCGCEGQKDYTGQRFGKLTVIRWVPNVVCNNGKITGQWLCKCDCGNEKMLSSHRLTSGNDTSCAKCDKTINMVGQRYGLLTVIAQSEPVTYKNGKSKKMWKCQCDCGNTIVCSRTDLTYGYKRDCGCVKEGKYLIGKRYGRLVIRRVIREKGKESRVECICDCGRITTPLLSRVINNKVYSCGCYASEKNREIKTKHGKCGERLYGIWLGMKARCLNPHSINYKNYGGRGITVCDEWKEDFQKFYDWAMENGYSDELSIDRIDNDGNYEPGNCKWSTRIEQANNQRKTVHVSVYGELLTIREISEKYGIPMSTLKRRLQLGYTSEETLLYKGNLQWLK